MLVEDTEEEEKIYKWKFKVSITYFTSKPLVKGHYLASQNKNLKF